MRPRAACVALVRRTYVDLHAFIDGVAHERVAAVWRIADCIGQYRFLCELPEGGLYMAVSVKEAGPERAWCSVRRSSCGLPRIDSSVAYSMLANDSLVSATAILASSATSSDAGGCGPNRRRGAVSQQPDHQSACVRTRRQPVQVPAHRFADCWCGAARTNSSV